MQRGRYPRILPAAPAGYAGQSSASGNPGEPGKEVKKRLTSQPRPGACLDCRTRKTKCDGLRPACTNCSKRGHAVCVYPERLVNGQKAIELVELLKSSTEDRSNALLKRLREKGDPSIVLAESRGGPSEGSSPSKLDYVEYKQHQSSLEGELMANNPKAFPILPPIDPIALARSNLLRPWLSDIVLSQLDSNEAEPNLTAPSEYSEPQEQPIEYCDERLQYLQVGFWTNIKISNDFVAKVISVYMKTDHPLLGLFDTHLFINDLVNQHAKYCSKFLFHSVMYLGCQMYSSFDGSAIQYASEFCRVAESLWKTEKDSYPSMAGAILLSISLMAHGKNHAVLSYASDAMKMGTRLGLFGGGPGHAANPHQPNTGTMQDDLSARSHAAWGVFNWNVMISMFHRQPGSETPASAPSVPIPGETRSDIAGDKTADANPGKGGEKDGDDDEDENISEELIVRRLFPALCNFWRLVHEVRWIYYPVRESPPVSLRKRLVEYAYRELLAWTETLPSFLIRRDQCPHFIIVFHIWLHTAILDMWQPFIYREKEKIPQLRTFSARDRTPDAAYSASVNQLKQLIVEYRSRHAASSYSILWHNGLIYLANAMLRCTDPEWHLYLLLCIYGYERLSRTFRISEVVAQGLLTMTMRDTDMTGREAYKIMETLKERGLIHVMEDLEEKIHATFMIDLNLAFTNPEAACAENMANEFTDLATFQDLVDLDPEGR
ncbi:hypothetical protein F5B22DRAFT_294743 [Xylaria bambusicola]|uniref:uncharacterized protein n=1 Tax=Xylaria bambusicola TaxID=326684 RepID=UPI0020080159|nr:uncharacterized protein F5B22DRAFT_294743 [Xylaria bambusicola]KAI0512804.1 hypothetical protein F5B22DRAFT_294743 [Xylaria bambusicola]